MTTQTTTKPCPFCGGEASAEGKTTYSWRYVQEQELEQDTFYFVNCMECGVSNKGLQGHISPSRAIEKWNRRAI